MKIETRKEAIAELRRRQPTVLLNKMWRGHKINRRWTKDDLLRVVDFLCRRVGNVVV